MAEIRKLFDEDEIAYEIIMNWDSSDGETDSDEDYVFLGVNSQSSDEDDGSVAWSSTGTRSGVDSSHEQASSSPVGSLTLLRPVQREHPTADIVPQPVAATTSVSTHPVISLQAAVHPVAPSTSASILSENATGKRKRGRPRLSPRVGRGRPAKLPRQLCPPTIPVAQSQRVEEPIRVPSTRPKLLLPIPPYPWTDANEGDIAPTPTPFVGTPHMQISLTEFSAISVLEEFWTPKFFETLVNQTNIYAQQYLATSQLAPHALMANWEPVDEEDIRAFLAIILSMGIVQMPSLDRYWSINPLYQKPFCASLMPRNRFNQILKALHVNDNYDAIPHGESGYDALHKVRTVIDVFQEKFREAMYPQQNISIDEAICPFKGRVRFLAYNPAKPYKWGLKIYQLCESSSGYCFEFEVANGDSNKIDDLVMSMMERYLDKGHVLYMDRFYSSVKLYEDLYARGTLAVGTVIPNRRSIPKGYLEQRIQRGTSISCRKGPLLATKWRGKIDVVMLSTMHKGNDWQEVEVRARGGKVTKLKPTIVQDYNDHMAGVDKSDQLLSYYAFRRKTMQWWKKLFFHLLNLSIVNAHILYNHAAADHGCEKITLLRFIENVIEGLIQQNVTEPSTGIVPKPANRLTGRHFPAYISFEKEGAKRKHAQMECVVCKRTDSYKREAEGAERRFRGKKTQYKCKQCGVPLCVDSCFEAYHTSSNCW